MKTVEAYFGSWNYPAHPTDNDPECATVSIKYADDTWEEIFRLPLEVGEYSSTRSYRAVARAILEHFTQSPVSEDQVGRLLDAPGLQVYRLTPKELKPFAQGSLF